jgi:hypothetical protein
LKKIKGWFGKLTDEKWSCRDDITEVANVLFRLGQELDQAEKLSGKIQNDLAQNEIDQQKQQEKLKTLQSTLHESRENRPVKPLISGKKKRN